MKVIGRYVVMAVLGMSVAACGGKSDPSENIENESGVVLNISGIAEFETSDSQTSVAAQQLERVGLFFTNQEKRQTASDEINISKVINVPLDSTDEDSEEVYTAIQLAGFIQYINNRLSTIDFGWDTDASTYGYDFAVREPGNPDNEYWRASEMLDWCLTLNPEHFSDDFTIDTEYEPPATLLAAEAWAMSEDERYQSCPSNIRNLLVTTWIGRGMEDIQNQFPTTAPDEGEDAPSIDDIIEALLQDPNLLIDAVAGETAQVELVVELYMNEFELLTEPFVFTVNITQFDYDTISTE